MCFEVACGFFFGENFVPHSITQATRQICIKAPMSNHTVEVKVFVERHTHTHDHSSKIINIDQFQCYRAFKMEFSFSVSVSEHKFLFHFNHSSAFFSLIFCVYVRLRQRHFEKFHVLLRREKRRAPREKNVVPFRTMSLNSVSHQENYYLWICSPAFFLAFFLSLFLVFV